MASIFFDLRGQMVRVLITDGKGVVYHGMFEHILPLEQPQDDESGLSPARYYHLFEERGARGGELAGLLTKVSREARMRIDHVHLIPPLEDVELNTHRLPKMSQQDMEKVVARKLGAGSGEGSSSCALTLLDSDQSTQNCISEHLPREVSQRYQRVFAAGKVKLLSISTSLSALLAAFAEAREEMIQANAIFDINRDSIEVVYLTNTLVIHHERVQLAVEEGDDEAVDGEGSERQRRRRLFALINNIYTMHSRYMAKNSHFPVVKVWLSGSEVSGEEVSSAVHDAIEAEVVLADSLMPGLTQGEAYTALVGLARGVDGKPVTNLIPPDMLRHPWSSPGHLLAASAVGFSLLLVVGFVLTEGRYVALQQRVEGERKELAMLKATHGSVGIYAKSLESLKSLTGNQVHFYPIFRELAEKLPEGVYLEGMKYRRNGDKSLLEITAVTEPVPADLGRQRLFTRLMEMLDSSPYLSRHEGPAVSIVSGGDKKDKKMLMTFFIEVRPVDATH